jgi:hypothetical protein
VSPHARHESLKQAREACQTCQTWLAFAILYGALQTRM